MQVTVTQTQSTYTRTVQMTSRTQVVYTYYQGMDQTVVHRVVDGQVVQVVVADGWMMNYSF